METIEDALAKIAGDKHDSPYLDFTQGDKTILIDGRVTVEQMKQLIALMEFWG